MLKKWFCFVLLAAGLAACNSDTELGPEYTTLPLITELSYTPRTVTPDEDVTVSAKVYNRYGNFGVQLVYVIGDTEEAVEGNYQFYPATSETVTFTATIPAQADGTTVWFQVYAVNQYQVTGLSELASYTVGEEAPMQPQPES